MSFKTVFGALMAMGAGVGFGVLGGGCDHGFPGVVKCGNGKLESGEGCDDGNSDNTDSCLDTCEAATCGDGFLWVGQEECDDGNTVAGDGCSATCVIENPGCGNGFPEPGEECDDGNSDNTDSCLDTCEAATCGDGYVWVGFESCDDGNTEDGDGCSATCGQESVDCGNGLVEGAEECDDGNTGDGDGCSVTCEQEAGWVCSGEPSVCVKSCGNGMLNAGEECDDGNTEDGDGCSVTCEQEAGWVCSGEPSVCVESCGNGMLNAGEECDDGGVVLGDGCSGECVVEPGWTCSGEPSVCNSQCGDGFIVGDELCDDNNNTDGDGCSVMCTVESGWSCAQEPSVCETGESEWVFIPAGSFLMGADPNDLLASPHEVQHPVVLTNDFEMLSHAVTQGDFEATMGYNPSINTTCGADCPVHNVSQYEATAYCNALSASFNLSTCYECSGVEGDVTCSLEPAYATPYDCPGYRLPTDAEWEYAARARTLTNTYNGDITMNISGCEQPNSVLDSIAWFCGNSGDEIQPVKFKDPNGWMLYDMIGNVREWTQDIYAAHTSDPATDPWGPVSGFSNVVHGGWAHNGAHYCRVSYRSSVEPDIRVIEAGFRPVRTLP